ncbi:MAG: MGMT family protein [Patescibacteria group bacterium]|nr:MGMT family protein [Patescibacteria group bacterium]
MSAPVSWPCFLPGDMMAMSMRRWYHLRMEKSFADKVRDAVRRIPRGATLTYGQVAALAGRPKAHRAVGNILNKNYDPEIPCHRVVRSDGTAGGYNRGSVRKKGLLESERR